MTGHVFCYYREFSVKALGLMLNVKFSGRREWNKDDLFGFERLKVDDNSHVRGIYGIFEFLKHFHVPCLPLFVSYDSSGKKARQLVSCFYRWGNMELRKLEGLAYNCIVYQWLGPFDSKFSVLFSIPKNSKHLLTVIMFSVLYVH